jgi:hypothetical protein
MPTNAIRVLQVCKAVEEVPVDRLCEFDRNMLLKIRRDLSELKDDVEHVLQRLSFLDAAPN